MSEREARGRELFLSGLNCAQSVFVAFADLIGLTEHQAALVSAGFGGGMGRLRENCGAFSAMVMLCGAMYGEAGAASEMRSEVYTRVQEAKRLFLGSFGTTQCSELLGIPPGAQDPRPAERTPSYYADRPCLKIVSDTCALIEGMMAESREEAT